MDIFVTSISSCIILHMVKLFHIKIKKISFCHNSSVKVNNSHPPLPPPSSFPPKRHIDVKCGNLNMDVAPVITSVIFFSYTGCILQF